MSKIRKEQCYHVRGLQIPHRKRIAGKDPKGLGGKEETLSQKKSIKVLTIDEAGFKHPLNQRTSIPGH